MGTSSKSSFRGIGTSNFNLPSKDSLIPNLGRVEDCHSALFLAFVEPQHLTKFEYGAEGMRVE